MKRKRVAIVGAGPAGAATALSLLNTGGVSEFEVTLYHRSERKHWHMGETIPPAANILLDELGIKHVLDSPAHIPCPGNISVWGGDKPVANDFLLDLSGPGYHLDRTQFESDLLAAAEKAGARIKPGHTLSKVSQPAEGFELGFRFSSGEKTVSADFVVDTTGQPAAFVRRLSVARNVIDEVISIYACMPIPPDVNLPDYTLLEAVPGGWWYLSKMSQECLILSFTTDKEYMTEYTVNSTDGWRQAYTQTRWLRGILPEDALVPTDLNRAPACSAILTVCVGDQWLAAGDAACSYDSITSAGITRSLFQGKQAGAVITEYFASDKACLDRYQDTVFEQFNRYIGLRDYLYGCEQRFNGPGFWCRRQAVSQG